MFDGDESNIESWYDYLLSLATAYQTEYATNCEDEALEYSSDGWGTVTVNSASLAYYDSDGNEVEAVTYSDSDTNTGTGTNGGSGGGATEGAAMSNMQLSFVAMIVGAVATLFVGFW